MSLNLNSDEVFYVAASLLVSVDSFKSGLASLMCGCGQPCVINTFIELSRNISNYSSRTVKAFANAVINYLQLSNQYDEENIKYDPIDIVSAVLINFHCLVATRTCYRNEDSVLENCYNRCPLHNIFYLGVKEIYTCKCGESYESLWEHTNVCQFFNTSGIFEGCDLEKSSELAFIPKEVLAVAGSGNSEGLLNAVCIKLRERLEGASVETCQRDECKFKESSVIFEVINAPKVFMIDLIWDDDPNFINNLKSFLATVGLKKSIKLLDIYINGQNKSYILNQIIFNRGDLFKIARSKDQYWEMEGLHNQASWEDLLKEITLHRLHPISAIYLESSSNAEFNLSKSQLLKIEQKAAQCDNFSAQFGRPCINEATRYTGLFKEPKKIKTVIQDSKAQPQLNNIPANRDYSSANPRLESNLEKNVFKEETKVVNEEKKVLDRMQKINTEPNKEKNKKLPSQEGWICNYCYQINKEETPYDCEFCGKKELNRYQKFAISSKAQKNLYEPEQKPTPKPNPKLNPNTNEIKVEIWDCTCGTSNLPDYLVCPKCYSLKPGIKGWVCNSCKTKNEETDYRCLTCGSYKDSLKKPVQDFWICDKCNTAIIKGIDFCDKCVKSKSKTREVADKPAGVSNYIKCPTCNKETRKNYPKCLWCNNSLSSPEKPRVEENLIEENKKVADKNEWICENCNYINSESNKWCRGCYEERSNRANVKAPVQVETRTHETKYQANTKSNYWNCRDCDFANMATDDICYKCNKPKEDRKVESPVKKNTQNERSNIKRENEIDTNEWICLSCNKTNSYISKKCLRCKIEKPVKSNASRSNKSQDILVCQVCKKEIVNVICDCKRTVPITYKKCIMCDRDLSKKKVCGNCDYIPTKGVGYSYLGRYN